MPVQARPESLPAKLFLLAHDPEKGRARGQDLGHLLRGAVLADLSLRGCLSDDDGKVRVTGTKRTGDRLLDNALREMDEDTERSWRAWIRRGNRRIVGEVRDQLAADGLIRLRDKRFLGLFRYRQVIVADPEQLRELRTRLRSTLSGTKPAKDVERSDAALVALAAAAKLRTVLSNQDRREYRDRIETLSDRAGEVIPALRKVLAQVRAARAAAYASGG